MIQIGEHRTAILPISQDDLCCELPAHGRQDVGENQPCALTLYYLLQPGEDKHRRGIQSLYLAKIQDHKSRGRLAWILQALANRIQYPVRSAKEDKAL
jgi:hypothetical protein